MRDHYMRTRMAKMKKTDDTKCRQRFGAARALTAAGGNAKWYSYFRRQFVVFLQLNMLLTAILLLGGQVSSLLFIEGSQWQLLALLWPKATSSCPWVGIKISDLSYYGRTRVQHSLVPVGVRSHAQGSESEILEDFHSSWVSYVLKVTVVDGCALAELTLLPKPDVSTLAFIFQTLPLPEVIPTSWSGNGKTDCLFLFFEFPNVL